MSLATVYIASSWKNQHAVEMLTDLLEDRGYEVMCFVRNSYQERECKNFEEWVCTDMATKCFVYDTNGATKSDLVLYLSPSGTDAWAEVGAAWASGIPIVGLWAKGESAGLMRHMISYWFKDYRQALDKIDVLVGRRQRTLGGQYDSQA